MGACQTNTLYYIWEPEKQKSVYDAPFTVMYLRPSLQSFSTYRFRLVTLTRNVVRTQIMSHVIAALRVVDIDTHVQLAHAVQAISMKLCDHRTCNYGNARAHAICILMI